MNSVKVALIALYSMLWHYFFILSDVYATWHKILTPQFGSIGAIILISIFGFWMLFAVSQLFEILKNVENPIERFVKITFFNVVIAVIATSCYWMY